MDILKIGSKGNQVKELQELLTKHNYELKPDGDFGQKTLAAVISYQKDNKLTEDGVVGYYMWESLLTQGHVTKGVVSEEEYKIIAKLLNCEVPAIKAVKDVETGGNGGFIEGNKPKILFEGHIFWKELQKIGIKPQDHINGNEDILYQKWTKSYYKGGIKEYDRLEKAKKINVDAANASASWGMFQIMGMNYQSCGEKNVNTFVADMCESEFKQMLLFARFITLNKIVSLLVNKDWAGFARKYNGPQYAENKYDKKLENSYKKYL